MPNLFQENVFISRKSRSRDSDHDPLFDIMVVGNGEQQLNGKIFAVFPGRDSSQSSTSVIIVKRKSKVKIVIYFKLST